MEEKLILRENFDNLIEAFTRDCNTEYQKISTLIDSELNDLRINIKNFNNIISECSDTSDKPFT